MPALRSSQRLINFLRFRVGVGAVEENDFAGELGLLKNLIQVFLGAAGFGEDQGLLLKGRHALALLGLLGGGEAAS